MSADYTDTDIDVLKACLVELAQQARQDRTDARKTECDRMVTHSILEDV